MSVLDKIKADLESQNPGAVLWRSRLEDAMFEIERLQEALQCIADFEQDIHVKDADAISYMRNTAKAAIER